MAKIFEINGYLLVEVEKDSYDHSIIGGALWIAVSNPRSDEKEFDSDYAISLPEGYKYSDPVLCSEMSEEDWVNLLGANADWKTAKESGISLLETNGLTLENSVIIKID